MKCQHFLLEDKNTTLYSPERFNCRGQHWRWAVSWFWFLRNLHVFWAQSRVIYIFAPRTAATAWIVDPTRQLLQLGFDSSWTCVFRDFCKSLDSNPLLCKTSPFLAAPDFIFLPLIWPELTREVKRLSVLQIPVIRALGCTCQDVHRASTGLVYLGLRLQPIPGLADVQSLA